jgi:hypothetical protein
MTLVTDSPRFVALDEARLDRAPADWPSIEVHGAPDATWTTRAEGALVARCSVWWNATPALQSERVGIVGHFGATSADAARDILATACNALYDAGATIAIGPMDGSTWRRYRLVTHGQEEPAFFLEPSNPHQWPEWFESAGWRIHSRYHSAVNEDLSRLDATVPMKAERLADRGVTIREMDILRADAELRALHAVATAAFHGSHLYTPLPAGDFVALYDRLLPVIDQRLISIAEHEGRVVGFCFCLPNVAERARGERMRSAILKTFAVLPEYTGLGGVLAARTNAVARELGFTRVIHALMHERNDRSRALSARSGREIRRYALFERRLRP